MNKRERLLKEKELLIKIAETMLTDCPECNVRHCDADEVGMAYPCRKQFNLARAKLKRATVKETLKRLKPINDPVITEALKDL